VLLEIKKLFHTHTGRYKSSGPPKPISFLYIPTIPNLRKTGTPSDSQPMAFLFFVSAGHLKKGLYTECWGTLKNIFFLYFQTPLTAVPDLRCESLIEIRFMADQKDISFVRRQRTL